MGCTVASGRVIMVCSSGGGCDLQMMNGQPMKRFKRCLACVVCAWAVMLALAGAAARGEQGAVTGEFANGTMFNQMLLSDWNENSPLRLMRRNPDGNAGQPFAGVLDPRNPVRWMAVESGEAVREPEARVEMVGGDRLPGRVVEYQNGGESLAESRPGNLIVKADVPIGGGAEGTEVRVVLSEVKRIVWQPVARVYNPGVVYLTDGRQVAFRRVRWTAAGVTLMLEDSTTRSIPFTEIAELHMPRRDAWQNYCRMLARLTPDCTGRLMRIETSAGLIATTTVERLRFNGNESQMIQTAWCLDPIWTPVKQVVARRFAAANEVSLSMLDPVRVVQESPLGGVRPWQADRSVKGRAIRGGGRLWGWGFGVHANNVLEFELPSFVRAFHTRAGLDDEVLRGGCAKVMVYANAAQGTPLWQSGFLIGSKDVADAGMVALSGPDGGQKTLLLVADMAHEGRPAGADPLNIRDMVDWMEPMLELDGQKLAAAVASAVPQSVAAWTDWSVAIPAGARLTGLYRWEDAERREIVETRPTAGHLVLSRETLIGPQQAYLVISASCGVSSTPTAADVRVNGKLHAHFDLPPSQVPFRTPPRLLSLQKFSGQTVKIDIELIPSDDKATVNWRCIGFTSNEYYGAIPLQVTKATAGTPLTVVSVEPQGVVLALNKTHGQNPQVDVITVVTQTAATDITGFRLELLADRRLPNQGPGRQDGSVMLSEFTATTAPLDKPDAAEAVNLVAASADSELDANRVTNVIDAIAENAWRPNPAGQDHVAVFKADRTVGFPVGTILTFTLSHPKAFAFSHLGKFRITAVRGTVADPPPRPGVVISTQN